MQRITQVATMNSNHPFIFVLDTEFGPEMKQVQIDAPTAEKAEEILAEEYGADVWIVSINGQLVNRRPIVENHKGKMRTLMEKIINDGSMLGRSSHKVAEEILSKEVPKSIPGSTQECNIVTPEYISMPGATISKSWK